MPGAIPGIAAHLKILIVTDAWKPQVNGVVRTLEALGEDLAMLGHTVRYATPEGRFTVGLPTYPEIRLAVWPRRRLEKEIRDFAPDAVHIATEGTLGMSARAICLKHGIAFSTSFHTRFPEYVRARFPLIPEELVYRWLRWFHGPATAMMVATESLRREMAAHGFTNLRIWSRGVDVDRFHPVPEAHLPYPEPIWIYVGRVAVEKNIEAFLALDLPGTKLVVGDGPAREALEIRYPDAKFLGNLSGEALVRAYAASTSSCFPAAPTLSGWSCWRRWPADCRLPPIRSRGPWTWWAGRPWPPWTKTWAGLPGSPGDRPPSRSRHPPRFRGSAFLAEPAPCNSCGISSSSRTSLSLFRATAFRLWSPQARTLETQGQA